jgi:alpha-amylase/alpha-mannosidase (GH57 family)
MNYLCIHSHFYQPPRENPWLESIELQDSAYPYHDWNDRISAECYHPNAAARILDDKDRIIRIVNNFASMSFNVGPTLLSWMEVHAPDVYSLILEANRDSRRRFSGHGNAIAQVYNHMIMPLANTRDKRTQILWGIADFESRYGYRPEGMWLAETAVDMESLELMASNGITFTILSPYQAQTSGGQGIDSERPYKVKLPGGRTIAVFFYNGAVSQAVAFERLLENGERFAQRLVQGFAGAKRDNPLMHIATDGETYGHHHRHGEMALAYAIEYIEQRKLARLTNYGEFLEKFPPSDEVSIVENSAWSCSHGVGRWSRDCGCNTGFHWGWNQEWRGPLRDAYNWLRDTISPVYQELAHKYVEDPWAARDEYIKVLLDQSQQSFDDFLAAHSRGNLKPKQRVELRKLLEMQRHAMLMYTSCGWFFDDLGGIETVQTMQYAGRALQLFEQASGRRIQDEFLALLAKAQSNDKEKGSGADIYRKQVIPAQVDLQKLAAHYAISSLFEPTSPRVHCYQCTQVERRESQAGRLRAATGIVQLSSQITGESGEYAFGVVHFGDHNLTGAVTAVSSPDWYNAAEDAFHMAFAAADIPALVRLLDREWGGADAYTLRSLFRDQQRRILREVLEDTLEEVEGAYHRLYDHNLPLMRFLGSMNTPMPAVLQTTAATALNTLLKRSIAQSSPNLKEIGRLLDEAKSARVDLDATTLEYQLRNRINSAAQIFASSPKNAQLLSHLLDWVKVRKLMPFVIHPWEAQNRCYAVYRHHFGKAVKRAAEGDHATASWVTQFRELADALGVYVPPS